MCVYQKGLSAGIRVGGGGDVRGVDAGGKDEVGGRL